MALVKHPGPPPRFPFVKEELDAWKATLSTWKAAKEIGNAEIPASKRAVGNNGKIIDRKLAEKQAKALKKNKK